MTINYRKSARALRLGITVKQGGEVTVTVPLHVSLEEAESFVASKA